MDTSLIPFMADKISEESYRQARGSVGMPGISGDVIRLNISREGNWQIHSTSKLFDVMASMPLTNETTKDQDHFKNVLTEALEMSIMPQTVHDLKDLVGKRTTKDGMAHVLITAMPPNDRNMAIDAGKMRSDEVGFYAQYDGKNPMGVYDIQDVRDFIEMVNKRYPDRDIVAERVRAVLNKINIEHEKDQADVTSRGAQVQDEQRPNGIVHDVKVEESALKEKRESGRGR